MAKTLTYVMCLVFIFAGLGILGLGDTGTSQLLKTVMNGSGDFKIGDLWALVFGTASGVIATLGLGGVLIAGLYRQIPVTQVVLAGFTAALAGWITGDLITLWTTINTGLGGDFSAVGLGIKVLITSLLAGAVLSLISFWMGNDF